MIASLASLAGCHTFETEDGGTFTAFGMPWGLMGSSPDSWLTQNLGEVIIGATAALTGGHVLMARRRRKTDRQPIRTVLRAPAKRPTRR